MIDFIVFQYHGLIHLYVWLFMIQRPIAGYLAPILLVVMTTDHMKYLSAQQQGVLRLKESITLEKRHIRKHICPLIMSMTPQMILGALHNQTLFHPGATMQTLY